MKAVLQTEFGGVETLYIGETAMPALSENEVLIEVHYAALNRADLLQRKGKYPPPKGESEILGLEASGIVKQVGKNVKHFTPGDRVMTLLAGGGQAEYVKADQRLVMHIPDSLTLEQGAAIPEVFLTANQALFFEGKTKFGSTVLIHAGASGVGTSAIQLAKARGCRVICTASAAKHATCKNLGADLIIDYKTQDFASVVKEFTKNQGVSIILSFIGAPNFERNLDCLAVDGTLMLIATMGGVTIEAFNIRPILTKRLKIQGTTLRARSNAYKQELIQAFSADFLPDLASGKITPIIDSVLDWKDIQQAHQRMEANKNVGKIVLKVK
ncbi:MAG: NAD(P)H-quinone oxidoreductase [Cyclobacteriaceae bacterium]|nr:NAD(P)H-quinone oxidoreductase [Cyclobacteriaceae bacterium]